MNTASQSFSFAKPPKRHAIVIERGDKVWRMSLRPWVLGTCAAAFATLLAAGIASTALFVMSDDIASAFRAREADTVTAYERRIADLRRELDRVSSREHAERRTMVDQVGRVLDRQREIEIRFERMRPLLSQLGASGLSPASVPVPSERPAGEVATPPFSAFGPEPSQKSSLFGGFDLRGESARTAPLGPEPSAAASAVAARVADLRREVEAIEAEQVEQLAALAEATEMRGLRIARVLQESGLTADEPAEAMGGPFVPVAFVDPFTNEFERLSGALAELGRLEDIASALPLASPVEHVRPSSRFGVRLDPFLKRPALHAGIDYPAPTGTTVAASASGTVRHAGRRGGYGLMVEIDHGGGYVTRYAHLSAIGVVRGQSLAAGETIGQVGSTGRSTGPHLHYEVHRNGKATDPTRYVEAGARLAALD